MTATGAEPPAPDVNAPATAGAASVAPAADPISVPAPAAPVAAEEPLPKPATWTVKAPEAPWCPDGRLDAILARLEARVAARFRDRVARTDVSRAEGNGVHLRTDAWTVTAAMRRGRRHAHTAAWSEDAWFASLSPHRGVLVVADGAGSAAWSRLGSALAADVAGEALITADAVSADAMHDAVARAVHTLRAVAEAMDVAPRELRTTLLAVAWEPDGTRHRLVTTQVGDGSLVLAHADGTINRPAAGDGGEWSGEVHCFVPDEETMTRARAATVVHDVPDLAALLLVTDGIDDPCYPFPRFAGPILGQLLHGTAAPLTGLGVQANAPSVIDAADPAAALHAWLGFEKRGENDDRTLAVALHASASHVIPPWAPSTSA